MRTFLSLVLLEIKLILRSKLSWILAFFSTIAILMPVLSLLFGQFFLVYHFIRDKRTTFSNILYTLPQRGLNIGRR